MLQKKDMISLIHQKENIKMGKTSGFLNLQEQKFLRSELAKELIISVSSMRLDMIVGRITGYSREKVKDLFHENCIVYSDEICYTRKVVLKEGDTFSIRKFGKYRISKKGSITKKGNFYLELLKYVF